MKSHSLINFRMVVAALGAMFAAGIAVYRAQADQWDKKTILTIDQPIQVTETLLEPGQYVLKLADSNSDRHIVQIFNSDQTHIIDTVLAVPNYRLQPRGHSRFAFWETPPGTAKALRAWFLSWRQLRSGVSLPEAPGNVSDDCPRASCSGTFDSHASPAIASSSAARTPIHGAGTTTRETAGRDSSDCSSSNSSASSKRRTGIRNITQERKPVSPGWVVWPAFAQPL